MLVLLIACAPERLAPPADRAEPQREAADVELVFTADGAVTQSGPIVEGATVHVVYDPDRLTTCRGRKYGFEAWGISAAWSIDGGAAQWIPVVMPSTPTEASFVASAPGTLALWFQNTDAFGCMAWDSAYGANYRFEVEPRVVAPDWLGNASSVISRATCDDGGPCSGDFRPLEDGFVYDTWARQRAAVRDLYFQVWAPGVTDVDDPDLWQILDTRMYWRFSPDAPFEWDWVAFDRRVGNDARYVVSLRDIDPIPGATVIDAADCPHVPLTVTPDGGYVETTVELYFSVNGTELRPADGGVFTGRFLDYVGLYSPCL